MAILARLRIYHRSDNRRHLGDRRSRQSGSARAVQPVRLVFFFNDTATTEIYTLSLHDALPIFDGRAEVVYQREPNGTAHALQQVEGLTGDVLVVNGDSPLLTAGTIRRLVDSHRQAKRPA